MMHRILPVVLLFILVSFKKDPENIPWQADRKLEWTDFRSKPDKSSSFFASTAYAVDCETEWEGGKLVFHITCSMQPSASWVKKEAASAYLLGHEQLHFDIAEWFTRKLRSDLVAARFTEKNRDKLFREITDRNSREREDVQRKYDSETRHSLNEDKQGEWERRVKDELSKLEEFAAQSFSVEIKSR